eukprot:1152675-Pelagomonas_calceolata.AAC.2
MLREGNFLDGPGLEIFIGKFTFWNNPKLAAKMRVSSEEFGVGISYLLITAFWQKHEGGRSLCIEDGRIDSVSQDSCHGLLGIDGCHGGRSSSSVGIECYSPREIPFSLEWRVSILGGLCEYERTQKQKGWIKTEHRQLQLEAETIFVVQEGQHSKEKKKTRKSLRRPEAACIKGRFPN